MIPLVAIVVAALVLPATAHAKVTCEGPVRPGPGVPLRGLPVDPVADRTYRLTVTLRVDEGVNPAPHLGAEHCGDDVPPESTARVGGWFRKRGRGVYVLDVKFPDAGPWAVSFMAPDGWHYDLGRRSVGPALPPLFQALWLPQFSTK